MQFEELLTRLPDAHRSGKGWAVRCPAHDDRRPSLLLTPGERRWFPKCLAGCSESAVLAAWGLSPADVWYDKRRNGDAPARAPTGVVRPPGQGAAAQDGAVWWVTYTGVPWEHWQAWGCEAVPGGVAFRWPSLPGVEKRRHRDGPKGLWTGSPCPPLWPELGEQVAEQVWLAEGESDCGVLRHAGLEAYAVTKGAATPPPPGVLAELRRRGCRRLVVAFDADDAGRRGAEVVAQAARAAGLDVAIVAWEGVLRPELGEKDVRDVAKRLGAWENVRQALEAAARPWTPPETSDANAAADATLTPELALTPPPFPVDVFPEPIRNYITTGARAMDCPPEFIGVPMLAEAAAAIGNRLALQVTAAWRQTCQVWACIVGDPGTAKSPAAEHASQPLNRLQMRAMADWREAIQRYEASLAACQAARKEAKNAPEMKKPERPELEHFFTTDATIEGLVRILAHPQSCTPGLVVRRDELVGWVRAFDAYKTGRGGERQTWMELWAGRPVKSDRAGRDPYVCEMPCVSVAGAIQPDMLPQLEVEAGVRDGFLERVLWSWPVARPMALSDVPIPADLVEHVADVFSYLRHANPTRPAPAIVHLSPEAKAILQAWHVENCKAQEHVHGALRGYYAKLPTQAARLCLILHALSHPADPTAVPVAGATLMAAITLVEYFRAHAHRVFERFGVVAKVQDSAALRLLRAIERLGGEATLTDLHDIHLRGEARETALKALERAGLITVATEITDGRPRTIIRRTGARVSGEPNEADEGGDEWIDL